MSNELTTILQSPTSLMQTGVDDDTKAVAGSGGNKRISIKGGVFRKMVGGKEVAALEERFMNVIFVKMAHTPSRQYYEGVYQEGAKVAPACWSNDAKTPDPEVRNPVAASCSTCPMSVKGSGVGGKGSACRLGWRTAVVLPADPGGDVMQLVLPATSCFGEGEPGKRPFRPYIQFLANNNVSAGRVVTRMQFDTNFPVPRVLFSPVSAVSPEDVEVLASQSKSAAAEAAIKLTVFKTDTPDEGVEVPLPPEGTDPEGHSEVAEPILRTGEAPIPEKDVSEIVRKWSRNKK